LQAPLPLAGHAALRAPLARAAQHGVTSAATACRPRPVQKNKTARNTSYAMLCYAMLRYAILLHAMGRAMLYAYHSINNQPTLNKTRPQNDPKVTPQ